MLVRLLGDAYDTADCMFDTTVRFPDGEALFREFVRRARSGSFDHTEEWMPTAFMCVGVEPGYDTFYVLRNERLAIASQGADSIVAVLRSEQMGYLSGGYHPETLSRADTMVALRTPYGWRIRSGFWNWIELAEAIRRGRVTREATGELRAPPG